MATVISIGAAWPSKMPLSIRCLASKSAISFSGRPSCARKVSSDTMGWLSPATTAATTSWPAVGARSPR